MAVRNINSTLKTSLMDYDPFVVAHLVKFEKPQKVGQYGGVPTGGPTDYTYITDSQYDLLFDDGSSDVSGNDNGSQTYRANKVLKIGTVNENIVARASNMSLVINSSSLGAEAEATLTFTSSEIAGDVDLVEAGFQEGDKILFTTSNGLGNHNKHVRIEKFKNGGKTIVYTAIDAITSSSTPRDYTISLAAEEIVSLIADKGSATYTNYINREVYIYKVHINPETRAIIGAPFLIFKGITSGASLSEKLESSEVTWTLSSHWGDFVRVQGRLTDDSAHRALKSDGSPDKDALIRPSYASDYGFIHSGTALNHIATYVGQETKFRFEKTGLFGLGSGRTIEYQVPVDRQVDLQFNPEARMLPVVYGVRKIGSFPVFVDTHKDRSDEIYKVDALCEGPIAGILDVHVDGNPSICLDASDFDSRSEQGANYDADFVEVICKGRADRGDTLGHYSAFNSSFFQFAIPSMYIPDILGDVSLYSSTYSGIAFSSSPTGTITTNTTGIRHRGTHTMTSPINADLTFHAGLADQNADNTLVNLAAQNKFKIQNDYYDDIKIPYWSPSHRLLDTAYVAGRYTIADGETTIPDIEYVVRGRDPECYNYDGSYKQPVARYFSTDAAHTAFPLGTSVTLHEAITNTAIGGTYTIVDKWFTYDVDGNKDHRFRFSPEPVLEDSNGDPITSFYMLSGTNKWHMMTWDHSDRSGSPQQLATAILPTVTTGTTKGLKITLGGTSNFLQEAFTNDNAQIGIRTTSIEEIMASTFTDADVTIGANNTIIVDNITDFSTNPGITQITVKNVIHLGPGASSQDDAYNDMDITITQERNGIPYIQKRKIIDYDGGTQCAFLDSSLDWEYPLITSDTYKLGSVGDRRVTLNPAMQLLDYMTNERYGKGLDINEDIDVEKFKQAARECDTRSDVTVVFSSGSFTEGQKWRYPASGDLQWEGTVDLVESVGGKVQVTFTDVVGKLGVKWNDHRTFLADRLYWYDGCAYIASGGVITTKPTGSGKETSVSIYLSSNTATTRAIDISTASADGNPLVKKHSTVTNSFTASGYSLYDSDNVKYWKYLGWDDASQRNVTRHQMNQIVDTNRALFENINQMLSQFNGMLQYSAGKYGLIVRGKKGTIDAAEQISEDDIIGTIKLSDKGLKSSKNFMSTSIVDPQNKFEGRSVTFFNSVYLKEDKGIQKKGSFNANGITNYFNTRFGLKQDLDESRFGLTIQFTMAPRGLLLQAGSIIELTYSRFGYNSKEFRITNLNFKPDGTVDVTADEHNDSAYVIEPAGNGHGAVEQVEVAQAPVSLPQPDGPTALQCSQTRQGEIVLTWTNSTTFSSATHITEIYSSTVNDFENTTDPVALIGTSDTNIFHDLVSEGSGNVTRYYWIRYQVRTPKLNLSGTDFRNVPSRFNPAAPESGTHTGVEGIGQAAFAVRTLTLDPGVTSAFVYNNAGDAIETGNHSATDITATIENDSGTVTYVWTLIEKDGTESTISGQTDADYTYNAPTNFSDMPQTIKVVATDTVTDENNVVTTHTATAQVTYIGVRTVEDGYTVTATTPTFNFQASSLGTIDGVDTFYTTFNVRRGGTALTFDNSATPAANTFQYGTITNITPTNSVQPDFDDGATLAEKEKVHISDASGNFLTGTTVTQCFFDVPIIDNRDSTTVATSRIVLSKSLDGINARTVRLTAPHIVITYDSDGANPSQSTAYDITATPFNTTGTPKYRFTDGSSELQAKSTDNTYEYTPPSSYSDLPDNIVVELYEDDGQAILATDTITISGSKEGAAGADAVVIAYDNSAHVVPVSVDGTEVWTGSGGLFEAYDGATELTFHQNAQSSSFPSAQYTGRFNLNITKVSGDTLTEPTNSGSGSVGATIGDFSGNLTTLTKYRITAYIRGLDGTTYTRHIDVSLAPADQGETGDDGLRTVSGRLYYEKTTSGAPSAPSGNSFAFNTGKVSGTGINDGGSTNVWKNSPNTQEATSTNTYYTVTYYGVEAAANSSTVTVTYGDVKEHTSFSGVVTFTDGHLEKDGTDIGGTIPSELGAGSLVPRGSDAEWELGNAANAENGIWIRKGDFGAENKVVTDTGPHGLPVKMWKSVSNDASGPDGGFENSQAADRFDIVSGVTYRFTVFVKQDNTNGSLYFGGYNYNSSGTNINLLDYDGGGGSTNKYWVGSNSPVSFDLPTQGDWYLWVGFINPAGTNTNSGLGGLYRVSTGVKSVGDNDLRFNNSATKFAVRTYQFYADASPTATTRWAHPRVDRMDRNAPSIADLISTSPVRRLEGLGITSIEGGVINAASTVSVGSGNHVAGMTGRNSDNTGFGSAGTDVRIFAGSTFDNRNTAPFRVQQDGSFRAEFGSIGGFTIGEDTLISSNTDNPLLTLGSNLTSNPEQQITLSSREQDDFLMYAGIEVPVDGAGVKLGDNPPFGVDSNGKVFMREFELKDANNNVILDSDNLLGPAINAQITNLLKAGADSVPYADDTPNSGFKVILTKTQNIQIDAKIYLGYLRIFGLDKDDGNGNGYTIQNALDSVAHSITVRLQESTNGSSWSTIDTTTFTGVKQAGYLYNYQAPSLGTNDYWIDGEEYFARSHGNAFRAEVRKGFGALDDDGNLSIQHQMQNKAAGTYYYRINTFTSGTRGVQFATRTYDHTQESWYVESQIYDLGYGTLDGTPTTAQMITNTRNFTIGTYSGSGTPGASYSIDENLNPPTVTEGKTFDDFLLLSGGTLSGTLTLNGNPSLSRVKRIDSAGQQIVLNAGESASVAQQQTAEYVYLNAEQGVWISSSRDNDNNWNANGNNVATHNTWNDRWSTKIGVNGNTTIPRNLTVDGTTELNGALELADGTKQYSAYDACPCYSVAAITQGGNTTINTPQKFWGTEGNTNYTQLVRYYEPSFGSIRAAINGQKLQDSNTVMYTMYVRNYSTSNRTRTFKIFRVDDSVYFFVNGSLASSRTGVVNSGENYESCSVTFPGKGSSSVTYKVSRIDIIKTDGTGDYSLEAYADLHDVNGSVSGSNSLKYQPFNSLFDASDENYDNVPMDVTYTQPEKAAST